MAKEKTITIIKRGKAEFNLIGMAKVSGFTFKTELESTKSDWIYNQMNLGVECGKEGVIYIPSFDYDIKNLSENKSHIFYLTNHKRTSLGQKIINDFEATYSI